ncbi:MAG TPA: response regulator [Desulfuromonadales bacterium]|nr:response regulator [Desulfuromonadales bacterium]
MQPTILLVEDDELVMDMTITMLEDNGYQVISTYVPEVALEYVKKTKNSVDLLLSDVIMPQMNGPELAAKIRSIHPELPVLFMSGYSPELVDSAMTGNRQEVIGKPFKSGQLVSRIQTLLKCNNEISAGST